MKTLYFIGQLKFKYNTNIEIIEAYPDIFIKNIQDNCELINFNYYAFKKGNGLTEEEISDLWESFMVLHKANLFFPASRISWMFSKQGNCYERGFNIR